MIERQELIEAIVDLEAQRSRLGDDAVDTAVWALRQKLAAQPPGDVPARSEQQQQLAVLVADLRGFTAASSALDAELVGEAINGIWQHLDGVVSAWGGVVDKHVGDGLIANFGLPLPRPDDAERAIRAALEMHLVLDWLNHQTAAAAGLGAISMRIGIHLGRVSVGQMGERTRTTAVGDAVTLAGLLEQAAPPGGILVSGDVERVVRGRFDLHIAEPVMGPGQTPFVSTYLVQEQTLQPHRRHEPSRAALAARLIGRDELLLQLQDAFELAADAGLTQLVTLLGDEGSGKSRLLDDFARWLSVSPQPVQVIRGRQLPTDLVAPHALVRSLLLDWFGIHVRYNTAVERDCLRRELHALVQPHTSEQRAQERVDALMVMAGYGEPVTGEANGRGLEALSWLIDFGRQAGDGLAPAVPVFLLEELHHASDPMLDLLDQLVLAGQEGPLLIVVSGDATLLEKRPLWPHYFDDPFSAYMRLDVPVLSAIDSRHLVNELLHKLPRVPLRLADLIVSVAEGNPYTIEQMVNFLVENQVLVPQVDEWRAQLGRLEQLRLPGSAADLLRMRLAALPTAEQQVLQLGSVFGRLFPDTAVVHLAEVVDGVHWSHEQLETALIGLETKGIIERSPTAHFDSAQEYLIRSAAWWNVAYGALEAESGRAYHRQAGNWLVANGRAAFHDDCAPAIARQFAQAGSREQAAVWRSRNGKRPVKRV